MRENRLSGSEGGGAKSLVALYPYHKAWGEAKRNPRKSMRDNNSRGAGGSPWEIETCARHTMLRKWNRIQ